MTYKMTRVVIQGNVAIGRKLEWASPFSSHRQEAWTGISYRTCSYRTAREAIHSNPA